MAHPKIGRCRGVFLGSSGKCEFSSIPGTSVVRRVLRVALGGLCTQTGGASDTSNSQDPSAKAVTGFALEAGTPEFLCKGVCLGGALHRNPGMKRTETRDFGMSLMSLLLRRRPRRAKAAKPRIWRAGLPCIGRADPSDGSRWHNYLAVSCFLRLKLQCHSDLR